MTAAHPLRLDPSQLPDAIERSAERLAAGHLLAFVTETVYGLGARADQDAAVQQIFQAKGRPSDHPLIVHVADKQAANVFASDLPTMALRLMDRFWPGPLTVIVPRDPHVAAASAGGQDTIGLRCPQHPMALALLQACARHGVMGVAAPSANRFGRVSPTRAQHVMDEFAGLDLWVLDGGPCGVGIESAIVDCSRDHPVLLRPGSLNFLDIESALGEPLAWSRPDALDPDAPRASGTLASHYAPIARVDLLSATQISERLDNRLPDLIDTLLGGPRVKPQVAVYTRSLWAHRLVQPGVLMRVMPAQAELAAQALFADLRDMDATGVSDIWVEQPPDDHDWDGVRDRLLRAATR